MASEKRETLLLRKAEFNLEKFGAMQQVLNNLDKEAKLHAKEKGIAWRKVKRDLTGNPAKGNLVATYTVPA